MNNPMQKTDKPAKELKDNVSSEKTSLLRFITCGSVDDGKSTLIGRLLYESDHLFDDQIETLEAGKTRAGADYLDFASLVDGLSSEREQGITIDVAYKFFNTQHRKYIIADTPGHEQYTRNMATAASTADLAIILIDARKGVLPQTQRHSFICSMLGVRQICLAINKMDLVDYSQNCYEEIVKEYTKFAEKIGLTDITPIAISALKGDNITEKSNQMSWYDGPALLPYLEAAPVKNQLFDMPFRLPVQWVNRPNSDFRGYSGKIASGKVSVGDKIKILPAARTSTVACIVSYDGDLSHAQAGQSITLTLKDEIDISRGDIISKAESPPEVADQFEARILWMDHSEMLPGRSYLLKIGAKTVSATIGQLKHSININTHEHIAAKTLTCNEIGTCNISLSQPIAFDHYDENHTTGGFILIDKITNNTVGMGLLNFALRRSGNIHWQAMDVDKMARANVKNQRACLLWFTGLSASGKSTIANIVEKKLHAMGRHTMVLDGDNMRHGLNRDLGFTDADRVENIRRVSEVAKLMLDAGLIAINSFISPFRAERRLARSMVARDEFIEIHIHAPLNIAEARDPKGLYKKARQGNIKNFTGIDSPYETPENPEIYIDTEKLSAEDAAEHIIGWLQENDYLRTIPS